jgi:hypothetical protein
MKHQLKKVKVYTNPMVYGCDARMWGMHYRTMCYRIIIGKGQAQRGAMVVKWLLQDCGEKRYQIKRAKAENEDKVSKPKPNTFHREETAGRNAVGENGTRKATSFDQVKEGELGKQSMSQGALPVHASMQLNMQSQEMITRDWSMIKQAKELGVPGMKEVAAAFMKKHFSYLFQTNE